MIHIKKKENETPSSLIYRFVKKVRQSGVLREARKRRYHKRPQNRVKMKQAALHRSEKTKEVARAKKMGLL